ncbi:MAG: class I SAM-dependent methyltransferase [Candidatus Micrarchaeota archaeon]|nr:class I SAM-dependent methyltransferase [Candidatus Micrarchaeota archaeon]
MLKQTVCGNQKEGVAQKIHCFAPNPFLKDKYQVRERREESQRKGNTENAMFYADLDPWGVWNTKLERYAGALGMDASKYISAKAEAAKKTGQSYRVLDIGMGTGSSWLPLLKGFPNIEFYGTALDMIYVHPELVDRTKICIAFDIGRHFPRGFFDMIISHNGMHHDELPTIWEMNRLLAPKGEAILTMQVKSVVFHDKLSDACPHLETISAASTLGKLMGVINNTQGRSFVSYHLKKIA